MRTLAPLTAIVALLLAVPAGAGAVTSAQRFEASVAPAQAGTRAQPRGVQLSVRLSFDSITADLAAPFATKSVTLWFDRNLVFNGAAFPTCSAARVAAYLGARCPKGSKVGSGTARGVALDLVEDLALTIFNGPNDTVELLVFATSPLVVNKVIEAPLRRSGGAYGYKLDVPIPPGLQEPYTGVKATLTDFRARVGGTLKRRVRERYRSRGRTRTRTVTKTISYLGIAGCTARTLHFRFAGSYSDGSSQAGRATQPCR